MVNPNFALKKDNIFTIRKKENDDLITNVKHILDVVKNVGYKVEKLCLEPVPDDKYDLMSTKKDKIVIKLEKIDPDAKKHKHIDLSVLVPHLYDNKIVIYGREKIPEFQLINYPTTVIKDTIKLTTNVWTFSLKNNKKNHCVLSIINTNKKINFALVVAAYYIDDKEKLEAWKDKLKNSDSKFSKNLYNDLQNYTNKDKSDILKSLGNQLLTTPTDSKIKARDFLFSLKIMTDVDIFSKKYMLGESIVEELLLNCINYNPCDIYLDFSRKRVRCFEYMIYSNIIRTIFNFCMLAKRSKYCRTSLTGILQNCGVSDIVQFDFCINPIEEITKLCTLSLRGPGGFSKDNVPKYYRDVHDSMKGRICSVDTPDRENCGVILRLLPNAELEEDLSFKNIVREKDIVSPACSFVPFLEHDDPTRLQMAASQMRQAVLLTNNEKPMIVSGCEKIYSDTTKFYNIATNSGQVIYKDPSKIIIRYDDGDIKIFDLGSRKLHTIGDVVSSSLEQGDRVQKGEVITKSNFCDNDGTICIGRNLLTAVMTYKGYNYEDGIVIREGLVDKLKSKGIKDLSFTLPPDKICLNLNDDPSNYKPIPEVGDIINVGDPYAITMTVPKNTDLVFEDPVELTCDQKIRITKVEVFFNEVDISGLGFWIKWIKDTVRKQKNQDIDLLRRLRNYLSKEELQEFSDTHLKFIDGEVIKNKYTYTNKTVFKIKDESIKGIFFKILGEYERPVKVGDKLGNRHGNKGVVSKIIPDSEMPKLDSVPIDIIINPLGIISRMNIGQLYELHLTSALKNLKTKIISMIEEGEDQRKIREYLLEFIKIISKKCKWYYDQFEANLPEINKDFVENLSIVQPPFESVNYSMIEEAMKFTDTPFSEYVTDGDKKIPNPISVGYMYFFRMIHIAEDKITGRGIGNYVKQTFQPSAGKKNEGGQRLGEMEFACLIAMDGIENANECMRLKADSINDKINWLVKSQDCLCKQETSRKESDEPETVRLLKAYLTVLGIKLD